MNKLMEKRQKLSQYAESIPQFFIKSEIKMTQVIHYVITDTK